jgi:hypothetical protein
MASFPPSVVSDDVAQFPLTFEGPGDTYSVPDVDPGSYDDTGLAHEAGPIGDIPKPGAGHPAAFSGITSGQISAEEN